MDRILNGMYKPGDRLLELQIAREMNTSQGPVREALRDLEGLGFIQSQAYKGSRVRALSERELKESYQVRAVLEELACQLAPPNVKEQIKLLEREAAIILKAANAADRKTYAAHDLVFHKTIVEASGNNILLSMWESVVLESRLRLAISRISDDDLIKNAKMHMAVIEALKKAQGKSAGKLLREHVEFAYACCSKTGRAD